MTVVEDELVLSSGRRLYCHGGVLGLGDDGIATHGWDGSIDAKLSVAERREIAAYMVNLWQQWGDGLVELGKVSDTGKVA